ncbi:MAG TPA: glucose-1-phosphate adenylyltransferase subunit GlgD [Selenomonadales bacterium]|nr:glucose-1-phosphate adenylyltransferase subunit GlgD [Selenomonadales bacterium]
MKNVLGIINLHEHEELLSTLTGHRPLAALPFGGRFRLIDFILSNMVNSGIHTVGVLTKHRFRSLIDHLRSGKEWDLARKQDGLFILPPPDHIHYSNSIYKGDLEFFYNNLDFIRKSSQEYILIAGSQIVCNINFNDAFRFHLERGADITLLYKTERPQPGRTFTMATLLNLDEDGRVADMEIKPGQIAGGNIGMEMLIVAKTRLVEIIQDCVARGQFDFTKEGIIRNLRRYRIYAYPYSGYMARIDSVQSFYRANLDLLKPEIWESLFSQDEPIYTKVRDEAPAQYCEDAAVRNSLVANGCIIEGRVENSLLFRGVRIARGAVVRDSIIMQDSIIQSNATLDNVICDKEVCISSGKRLSGDANFVMVIDKRRVV